MTRAVPRLRASRRGVLRHPVRHFRTRMARLRHTWRTLPSGTRYFLLLVGVVAFAAFNTINNLLYMVGGLMVALLAVSAQLARASVRGLTLTRAVPPHLYADDPVDIAVSLTNTKRRFGAFALWVQDAVDHAPTHEAFLLALPPGAKRTTQYRHTFARRGLHEFDALAVHSAFPFGFFPRTETLTLPQPVVVYPHIDPVDEALFAALTDPQRFAHLTRGAGANIYGIREYRHDDDARRICWKLSAKTGTLLMREFETEQSREVTIVFDTGVPTLDAPTRARFEAAVRVAASLVWALIDAHFSVGLVTRSGRTPVARGQQHLYRLLYDLALIAPSVGAEETLPPLRVGDVNPALTAVVLANPVAGWLRHQRFPVVVTPPDPAASAGATSGANGGAR